MRRRRRCSIQGAGRTKTGQLWAYARDDRPWGGADPPGVAYVYAPDRKAERPIAHLAGFTGTLQVDGYAGYRVLAERGDVRLAFCWAHVRRRFYELAAAGPAPIAGLYAIESDIRGGGAEERRDARLRRSRPVIDERELVLRLASLLWRLRRASPIETDLRRIQAEILRDRRLRRSPDWSDNHASPILEVAPICDAHDNENDSAPWRADRCAASSPAPQPINSARQLTLCFQRLANLDHGVFERLDCTRRQSRGKF